MDRSTKYALQLSSTGDWFAGFDNGEVTPKSWTRNLAHAVLYTDAQLQQMVQESAVKSELVLATEARPAYRVNAQVTELVQ